MIVPETPHSGQSERLSFPPLNFRAARQRLIIALVALVVAPLVLAALYALHTYNRAIDEQSTRLSLLAWVAESKLTNLLDVSRELATEVGHTMDSLGARQTADGKAMLRRRLAVLVADHPHIAALSVVDADGNLLASSLTPPTSIVAIDHADFDVVRSTASLYVTLPGRRREGTGVINLLVPRNEVGGRFDGAVIVAIHLDYLSRFCQTLIAENPTLTVGLYRQDGGIMIRTPAPRSATPPSKHLLLANAFAHGSRGIMEIDSPLDGIRKLLAYRRAGQYPLYASTGLAVSDLVKTWVREDMSIVLVALIPCVCLWLLIAFSLRRLGAEEASWHNWRRELSRRRTAEAATRNLQRLGALGNLVASVAHDFNNLLMVVGANMEIARRKNYNDVKHEVDAVERASTNARELARRLMSVARRQPLQLQVIQPERWLLETEPLLRSAVSSKVILEMCVADSAWPIKVDLSEITSAIINIAVNAKDAMPHGGTFTVSCANVTFSQSHYGLDAGDYVEISCEDSGTGMTLEVARHAFEPLFTTKKAGAGTGLGLAQVLAMAERTGGKARLQTEVGKGTTICIYVPRWRGEVSDASEPKNVSPVEQNKAKSTVLLVEDNDEVAAGLMAVLEVLGCDARHESSGDAALKVLEEGHEFDLVLSDIQMPGACDGIGLVEWIKKKRPQQAVTLMTGYAEHFEQARRLGVAVLSKPFNADDLNALLRGS